MRQRVTAGAGVVALVAVVFALNFYRLPVVALTPGPAEDVLTRVKVRGGTPVYDSKGRLYLTSVGIDDDVRFYEALLDFANRDVQLRPRTEVFPEGETSDEVDRRNVADMVNSKSTATVVALRELGYSIEPSGVEVDDVVAGTPAAGRLEAGDLIRVPRGTWHWFDLCADRRIRAIRLFQDPSGWTPRYTESGADRGYQPVCFGTGDLPHPPAVS